MKRLLAFLLVVVAAPLATTSPAASATKETTIMLVTHDAFAVSKPVLRDFTKRTGVSVKILRQGDAGAALNQAILTKDNPIGDVFFGVDNTFLGRALDADVFEAYDAPALSTVPVDLQLDPSHQLIPIDHGDVCINYDKTWFRRHDLAPPSTLDDLTKPAYEGLLVTEDASTSSPGLAFMLATIARYGENGWRDYWTKLRANSVEVVDDWTAAYEGQFSQGGNKGSFPLVVSYASSPPAAVYYATPQPKSSPIGTMLDSCFSQVEFAGVLAGTEHRAAARKFVDFMLSEEFQADLPLQMFVFPAREGTPLPPVFEKFAEVAPNPLSLPSGQIAQHRDEWIEQWISTVLR